VISSQVLKILPLNLRDKTLDDILSGHASHIDWVFGRSDRRSITELQIGKVFDLEMPLHGSGNEINAFFNTIIRLYFGTGNEVKRILKISSSDTKVEA